MRPENENLNFSLLFTTEKAAKVLTQCQYRGILTLSPIFNKQNVMSFHDPAWAKCGKQKEKNHENRRFGIESP